MPKPFHSQTKPCPECGERKIDPRAARCIYCRRGKKVVVGTDVEIKLGPAATRSFVENTKAGTAELSMKVDSDIRSLDDLIVACAVDLDVWEVERYICNKWEVGAKVDDKMKVTPLFQVKVWLKRRSQVSLANESMLAGVLADIRESVSNAAPSHRYDPSKFVEGDFLFEFAPFDLHMGKYTWAEETVTNGDIDSTTDLFNASLDYLLERAKRVTNNGIGQILCVFGNDVAHIDNKSQTTTGGTFMDADSRFAKMYRRIVQVHMRAVDILRRVAPVHIVIVPGNHDELTAFHLGMVLEARYGATPGITINNTARLRKYYSYGVNLFGFTHGIAERTAELPLTMAREVPEMWAASESREWHIGHLHKSEKWETRHPAALIQDLESDKGVRIRRLTSMSAHDAWHTKNAYMDRRACEAFVFHKTAGFTDQLSFNIDHFTGKGLTV